MNGIIGRPDYDLINQDITLYLIEGAGVMPDMAELAAQKRDRIFVLMPDMLPPIQPEQGVFNRHPFIAQMIK